MATGKYAGLMLILPPTWTTAERRSQALSPLLSPLS
jgi:hypothetical protein